MPKAVARVLFPYFTNAIFFGRYEEYYDAFAKEVNDLFAPSHLDENGEATNGTDIIKSKYEENEVNCHTDKCNDNGDSGLLSYIFWYDRRRDPFEIADSLDNYINEILKTTGAKKVSLAARCLGGSFLLTYVAKYGFSKVRTIAIDSTVVGSSSKAGKLMSGKITVTGEAIERYLKDKSVLEPQQAFLFEFLAASVDMLDELDRVKFTEGAIDRLYQKLYEGLIPKLVMASAGTWPGYWTPVSADDYQNAKALVFGDENSEYSKKYAGLIKKLDRFDAEVRQKKDQLLIEAKKAGVNVGVICKYGYQDLPFTDASNNISDGLADLNYASFGATVAPSITDTLSSKYIQEKENAGLEKYISPDRKVDASTCAVPESTWFIKGAEHHDYTDLFRVLQERICTSKTQLTVEDTPDFPQFMIYNRNEGTVSKMTEENCNIENWNAVEINEHSLSRFIVAIINFFKALFNLIKK